jgi:UDP-GlcNAc:undecaprenyl-phosphate/decaprenyl-phosphate GlcNAc-1-phosphate transferase
MDSLPDDRVRADKLGFRKSLIRSCWPQLLSESPRFHRVDTKMYAFSLMVGLALVTSVLTTPLIRRLALRLAIVDHPDEHRKLHQRSIPLGGGIAVLVGLVTAVACMLVIPNPWIHELRSQIPFLVGLSASAVVLCCVGLLDDRIRLRGRQKLVGQALAAGILLGSGLLIRQLQIFNWQIELGILAVPFTLFWLLGAINALNLIDGIDGLATSVGIVLSVAVAVMALLGGHITDAVVALALAGSLAGFLYYNFPPARIFLGDAGSMLIGLVLGALAIRSSLKGPAIIALAAPTAIWAIPIFDVSMAILRRKLTGRSLYVADRGHLHHCLQQRGYSGPKTLLWIGLLCACTAAGALASVYYQNELLAIGSALAVIGMLVLTRLFGHVECLLLFRQFKSVFCSLIVFHPRGERRPSEQFCTRFQGSRQWDDLWKTLIEFAERFDLSSIQLNVNLPAIHEVYHAKWTRKMIVDPADLWHTDIPLVSGETPIGRLRIAGVCPEGSVCVWMGDLIAGLKPFELHLVGLLEGEAEEAEPELVSPHLPTYPVSVHN